MCEYKEAGIHRRETTIKATISDKETKKTACKFIYIDTVLPNKIIATRLHQ